jgi:hypothetical protein
MHGPSFYVSAPVNPNQPIVVVRSREQVSANIAYVGRAILDPKPGGSSRDPRS